MLSYNAVQGRKSHKNMSDVIKVETVETYHLC